VTDYAENHLSVNDLEYVKSMIGTECRLSKYPSFMDGKREFILIDGGIIHEYFVNVQEIPDPTVVIQKLEAEKKEMKWEFDDLFEFTENFFERLKVSKFRSRFEPELKEYQKLKQKIMDENFEEEEIPDPTAQLQADKEELVSFLENLSHNVFWKGRTLDSRDKLKIKTLIQKMKQ
jgi:hypothetical protein